VQVCTVSPRRIWPHIGDKVAEGRNYVMQNIGTRSIDSARFAQARVGLETRITIRSNEDIVEARRTGSMLVQKMGYSGSRITLVTTVLSELARNILLYARGGEIVLSQMNGNGQLNVTALDQGPGIDNLPQVLAGGYSTSGGLGLGLSGLQRIVDEFEVRTQPGKGTEVFVSIHF
jgi:serine/threonine-protein kinase RsbT